MYGRGGREGDAGGGRPLAAGVLELTEPTVQLQCSEEEDICPLPGMGLPERTLNNDGEQTKEAPKTGWGRAADTLFLNYTVEPKPTGDVGFDLMGSADIAMAALSHVSPSLRDSDRTDEGQVGKKATHTSGGGKGDSAMMDLTLEETADELQPQRGHHQGGAPQVVVAATLQPTTGRGGDDDDILAGSSQPGQKSTDTEHRGQQQLARPVPGVHRSPETAVPATPQWCIAGTLDVNNESAMESTRMMISGTKALTESHKTSTAAPQPSLGPLKAFPAGVSLPYTLEIVSGGSGGGSADNKASPKKGGAPIVLQPSVNNGSSARHPPAQPQEPVIAKEGSAVGVPVVEDIIVPAKATGTSSAATAGSGVGAKRSSRSPAAKAAKGVAKKGEAAHNQAQVQLMGGLGETDEKEVAEEAPPKKKARRTAGGGRRSSGGPKLTKEFQLGDKVEAKWGATWYPAVVKEVELDGAVFRVGWETTGQSQMISAKEIRGIGAPTGGRATPSPGVVPVSPAKQAAANTGVVGASAKKAPELCFLDDDDEDAVPPAAAVAVSAVASHSGIVQSKKGLEQKDEGLDNKTRTFGSQDFQPLPHINRPPPPLSGVAPAAAPMQVTTSTQLVELMELEEDSPNTKKPLPPPANRKVFVPPQQEEGRESRKRERVSSPAPATLGETKGHGTASAERKKSFAAAKKSAVAEKAAMNSSSSSPAVRHEKKKETSATKKLYGSDPHCKEAHLIVVPSLMAHLAEPLRALGAKVHSSMRETERAFQGLFQRSELHAKNLNLLAGAGAVVVAAIADEFPSDSHVALLCKAYGNIPMLLASDVAPLIENGDVSGIEQLIQRSGSQLFCDTYRCHATENLRYFPVISKTQPFRGYRFGVLANKEEEKNNEGQLALLPCERERMIIRAAEGTVLGVTEDGTCYDEDGQRYSSSSSEEPLGGKKQLLDFLFTTGASYQIPPFLRQVPLVDLEWLCGKLWGPQPCLPRRASLQEQQQQQEQEGGSQRSVSSSSSTIDEKSEDVKEKPCSKAAVPSSSSVASKSVIPPTVCPEEDESDVVCEALPPPLLPWTGRVDSGIVPVRPVAAEEEQGTGPVVAPPPAAPTLQPIGGAAETYVLPEYEVPDDETPKKLSYPASDLMKHTPRTPKLHPTAGTAVDEKGNGISLGAKAATAAAANPAPTEQAPSPPGSLGSRTVSCVEAVWGPISIHDDYYFREEGSQQVSLGRVERIHGTDTPSSTEGGSANVTTPLQGIRVSLRCYELCGLGLVCDDTPQSLHRSGSRSGAAGAGAGSGGGSMRRSSLIRRSNLVVLGNRQVTVPLSCLLEQPVFVVDESQQEHIYIRRGDHFGAQGFA